MRPTFFPTARTHPLHLLIIGTFLLLVGAVPASAAPITYLYTGTLTSVDPLLAGQFSVGQTFSGSFTYDDSGPDQQPAATNVYGMAAMANSGLVGGYSFSSSSALLNFVNDSGPATSINYDAFGLAGAAVGGRSPLSVAVSLSGGASGLFDAEDPATLPLQIPALSNFTNRQFNFAFGDIINNVRVIGTVTSVAVAPPTAAVPEPASMLLLGTGIAGLAARRYRRSK